MSIINSQPLIGASGNQSTAYNLTRSLRFRSSASAYLNRTIGTPTSGSTWTISFWMKRGAISSSNYMYLFSYDNTASNGIAIASTAATTDAIYAYNATAGTTYGTTARLLRDPSSWYHIVFSCNAGTGTLYVNNQQQLTISSMPSMTNGMGMNIGRLGNGNQYFFDGYLTEVNFVDGQALTPSDFGETDTATGVWKPKKYTGTYGTNGFYLPFTDVATTSGSNAGLGKDFSGNGNYWTTNNISVTAGSTYDSMTDVPTLTSATAANYCVLNPLQNSIYSLTAGNLSIYGGGNSSYCPSTMQIPPTGKFYWEFKCTDTQTTLFRDAVGLVRAGQPQEYLGASTNSVSYCGFDGNMRGAISTGVYSTWTNGDVVGIAVDGATGKVWFSKNNVWQNSGNPSADTGQVGTISNVSEWMPAFGAVAGGSTYYIGGNVNFGQQPFAYTPPTGYVALNTYNLPDSTIVAGNTNFDVLTYTGNGATSRSFTGLPFKPDFIWNKDRTTAYSHRLVDSVRGVRKELYSNNTDQELDQWSTYGSVNSFDTDGYTITTGGTAGNFISNISGDAQVAWLWKAGQGTTSSNTSGSITSTVSANASAGFSVVTYTGTGSNATVGHGLGVAPKFIAIKIRNNTYSWRCYHASLGNGSYVYFNSADAATTSSTTFNNTSPTSSVFSVGTEANTNASGGTFVAYCWSEIAGFSKFGSVTGNGSADGSFVYLGFKPKYLMFKRSDSTSDWGIYDTSRTPYNTNSTLLLADTSGAETSGSYPIDFLSNGFKIRNSSFPNTSGGTYIFAAWAENPFRNALAT